MVAWLVYMTTTKPTMVAWLVYITTTKPTSTGLVGSMGSFI